MFDIDTTTNRIVNATIADSDGSDFWVGQVALAVQPKTTAVALSAKVHAAYVAGCPAAALVEAYRAARTPLFRLFVAEALQQQVQLPDIARRLGVTVGYLRQLESGVRRPDEIADEFALSACTVLCVPRLLVLYIAGRLTDDDFAELDSIGITAANHLLDLSAQVQKMADDTVEAAEVRIELEEDQSAPRRWLSTARARHLLHELETQGVYAGEECSGAPAPALLDRLREIAQVERA